MVTLIVIGLLLLIVTKPGLYLALFFFCVSLCYLFSAHDIFTVCVPPCRLTVSEGVCVCMRVCLVRSVTAICCRTSHITAC